MFGIKLAPDGKIAALPKPGIMNPFSGFSLQPDKASEITGVPLPEPRIISEGGNILLP